jgi:acetolactate synthase-1/2/3 large subunit
MQKIKDQTLCSDLLVDVLNQLEVSVVFCITGAGNLAIVDALVRDAKIKIVYSHHEQAAVMEAQGYSRVTGKIGVALVTTGGGTSNTLTGVLSAHLDSIPILLISGNESSFHCENVDDLRAYGVQGFDSCRALEGVTKKTFRLIDPEKIQEDVVGIVELSLSGRKGPVHIDIPMDLQRKVVEKPASKVISSKQFLDISAEEKQFLENLIKRIENSHFPILYIGNGCREEETVKALTVLLESLQIPFILSWSAIDLFPDSHPLNIGRAGIYGERATNILLQRADLLISIGTRLAIPQVGYNKLDFARNAEKWIIEIDETECSKFKDLNWNVCKLDAFTAISNILEMADLKTNQLFEPWLEIIREVRGAFPKIDDAVITQQIGEGYLHSVTAVQVISSIKKPNSIVVTDVGAGLLSGHYAIESKQGDRIFTSQGLGEMGFGLPAAIGAYFADKERQIICLNTDGAIMFNLQELQLIKEYQIPIKLFIFNNAGYSMIKISQENLFERRVAGSTPDSGISFPNFKDIAFTFGLVHVLVSNIEELAAITKEINDQETPMLIEIVMDPNQRYLPRLGTSRTRSGDLVSPPIEDLDPLIDIELLEKHLGYQPHANSYRARNLDIPNEQN